MKLIAQEQSMNTSDINAVAYVEDGDFYIGAEIGDEHMRCKITKKQAARFACAIIEEIADPHVMPTWITK